jgi:hypothetical protein
VLPVLSFFQAIFGKISFFKVSQDFRMFIFHFHEEMFFKSFTFLLQHSSVIPVFEVDHGNLFFYSERSVLWLFQNFHVTGTFINYILGCSIEVATEFREGFQLTVRA